MSIENLVWEQKHRPKRVDDIILPAATKKMIKDFLASGNVPNFLFASSSPGTGKTTTAYAIANELGADVLFINASLDCNIDALRTRITQFVSTVSFTDAKKLVILDECLSENETVRIGTINDWHAVKLKDLEKDRYYPVVSFNISNGEFENDTGVVISDKNDHLYEVALRNGVTVVCNDKHPFICSDEFGVFSERTVKDGLIGFNVVSMK